MRQQSLAAAPSGVLQGKVRSTFTGSQRQLQLLTPLAVIVPRSTRRPAGRISRQKWMNLRLSRAASSPRQESATPATLTPTEGERQGVKGDEKATATSEASSKGGEVCGIVRHCLYAARRSSSHFPPAAVLPTTTGATMAIMIMMHTTRRTTSAHPSSASLWRPQRAPTLEMPPSPACPTASGTSSRTTPRR